MKEITPLRKLQLLELEIFKAIVKICEENDITYYITTGTLLGAIRHKGFVPWDDDIDIDMPRKDYEKFLAIVEEKLPKEYKFKNVNNDDKIEVCFSRVESDRIEIKENRTIKENIRNAIAPLDGMPKSKLKFIIRKYKLLYLRMMFQYSNFSEAVNIRKKNRPLHEKILIEIGKLIPFEKLLDKRKRFNKLHEELKNIKDEEVEYYVSFLRDYKFKTTMKKDEIYKEIALYEFEGEFVKGPKEYHKYLETLYGNYMELPDSERNKHFTEVIDK